MRSLLKLIRAAVAALAAATALGAGAAAVAGLGGRWSGLLDVANHFAPIWLVLGLAAAVVCAVDRANRWRAMGVTLGVVAVLISGGRIAPELLDAARDRPAPGAPVLKLVQFNLWDRNDDPSGTLAWILAQHADVVATEENSGRAGPIHDGLSRAYPYWSSCDLPRTCQVMIYSRWPITARGSGAGPPMAWARLYWRGQDVDVIAIHDTWPYPPGPQARQLARLGRFVSGRSQGAAILAGDFNATPWSWGLKRLDRSMALRRRTHGQATWPAGAAWRYHIPLPFPILAIDQVYAGARWRTVGVRRGPRLGSDHYPVVVTLSPAL